MRKSIVNGNGATCDVCQHPMEPFEIYRLVGSILIAGDKYPDVSSDTRLKTQDRFHMCEKCYLTTIELIKNKKTIISNRRNHAGK